jgi:diguanylate cyclase (GGDEF)-like protein/PAS domain S-box-containing protein
MSTVISEGELREHLKRLTVLLVEDEEVSRELCSEYMSRFVGVLVTAKDGAEGLDAWRRHKPDIIITDIQMPVMDGLAMLQEIRSIDRAVPVIIMSAFEEPEYLKRSIDLGVSGYTFKPVNVSRFTEVLLNCAHVLLVEAKLVQARTAAENANAALESLIETMTDWAWEVDGEGRYTHCSPQVEKTLGYLPSEMIGTTPFDYMPSKEADQMRPLFAEICRSKSYINNLENWNIARNGSPVLLVTNAVPLLDTAGNLTGYRGVDRDITGRKLAEEEFRESESRFKGAFDYSAIGMALVSIAGKWLKANVSLCKMLGYSEEELLAKTFQDITHPDDLQTNLNLMRKLLAGEIETYRMEKRYFHKQGQIIWILLSVTVVKDNDDSPLYFIAQIENITERKQAEKALQERNKELDCLYSIISLSNDPDLSFDELLKRAVMRIPPAWRFPDITEACIEIGGKSFQTARFEETPWVLTHDIIAKENKVGKVTVCYLEERAFLPEELTLLNAITEELGLIVMSELARETISRLAVTDELTGLNNRRFFNENFSKALSAARRHRQPLSLISIDLDHFKKVNDTYGHTMGDLVLKEFSLLLKMMVRVEDIACRWGGEEFIVLLPNTTCEASVVLADRMRCNFEQYPRTTTPAVTASFGVARLQEGEDEDALMRRVDDALYQAKHEGRNRVVAACEAALS